jgi:NSS family neurotransmitter:Na+ symporter
MFYTSVSGWMLQYFVYMVSGKFEDLQSSAEISAVYGNMLENPVTLLICVAIVVLFGFGICSLGIQQGVEKISKFMNI